MWCCCSPRDGAVVVDFVLQRAAGRAVSPGRPRVPVAVASRPAGSGPGSAPSEFCRLAVAVVVALGASAVVAARAAGRGAARAPLEEGGAAHGSLGALVGGA